MHDEVLDKTVLPALCMHKYHDSRKKTSPRENISIFVRNDLEWKMFMCENALQSNTKKHFTTKLIKYNLHQIKCRLTICLLKTYKAMKVKRPSLLIFILGWLNVIYYHILLYIVGSVKGELTFLILRIFVYFSCPISISNILKRWWKTVVFLWAS